MTPAMIRIAAALASVVVLAFAPAAIATPELGEAGDLPASAQDLSADGVEQIDGGFADPGDVDMYKLCLAGGGSFSASTIGGTTVDTQLFLFDASGRGVYANDDSDAVHQSRLPSRDPLTPQAGGDYYLAVVPYNRDPGNSLGPIFPVTPGVEGPTGPGGSEPVTLWSGRVAGAGGPYSIFLTGAECAVPDTTPPSVDLRSPVDGGVVPLGGEVEVDFSCADEDGGSGLASCEGDVPDGGLLDTSAPGPAGVTVTALDNAGNRTSVTHTVTVAAADTIAPAIVLRAPFDGAVYKLGEQVVADYDCGDEEGGSGLVFCVGDVPDGAGLDTDGVGSHGFTVEAADVAGNTATVTVAYRVVYEFEGFRWPVRNRPHVNEWRAGVPVPIRFDVEGRRARDVIADGWPRVAEIECGSGAEPENGRPAQRARWHYDHGHRQRYVFLWKTERRWAGSCRQLMLKLDDGTIQRADFRFPRRWWHGGWF
jgi:Bacterial pre-peptidase C-terminal domain